MKKIKQTHKKIIILVLVGLCLYPILFGHLTNIKSVYPYGRCVAEATGAVVKESEMQRFFDVWRVYRADKIDQKVNAQISMLSGDLADALPWNVHFWFFKHCWSAKRFYYVEQRLRQILQTAEIRAHAQSSLSVLKKLMAEERDTSKIEAYRQMLEMHQKNLSARTVSEAELEMIKGSETRLELMLNPAFPKK